MLAFTECSTPSLWVTPFLAYVHINPTLSVLCDRNSFYILPQPESYGRFISPLRISLGRCSFIGKVRLCFPLCHHCALCVCWAELRAPRAQPGTPGLLLSQFSQHLPLARPKGRVSCRLRVCRKWVHCAFNTGSSLYLFILIQQQEPGLGSAWRKLRRWSVQVHLANYCYFWVDRKRCSSSCLSVTWILPCCPLDMCDQSLKWSGSGKRIFTSWISCTVCASVTEINPGLCYGISSIRSEQLWFSLLWGWGVLGFVALPWALSQPCTLCVSCPVPCAF